MTELTRQKSIIDPSEARWYCDPLSLAFKDTSEITPKHRIFGQDNAVEALRYGLANKARGNNIFVRGLSGFGRMQLIHQVIKESDLPPHESPDRCYLHNFSAPDQPVLLTLPTGRAPAFSDCMENFARFASKNLYEFLESEYLQNRKQRLGLKTQQLLQAAGKPFEAELKTANLALVPMQVGQNVVPVILPLIDGKPAQFEEIQKLRLSGEMSEEAFAEIAAKINEYEKKFAELGGTLSKIQAEHQSQIESLLQEEARKLIDSQTQTIRQVFDSEEVANFLTEVTEDLMKNLTTGIELTADFVRRYRVNVVHTHQEGSMRPIISVSNPTIANLVGSIEKELNATGTAVRSDHLMIKPGALLDADGGYLIIEAHDVLSEPGAWLVLLRVLKTGWFDLTGSENLLPWNTPMLNPEQIPVDIKIVMVGDPEEFYALDHFEKRFSSLFKVLADFSDTIERSDEGIAAYGDVLAQMALHDNLPPFSAAAVAKLIEHGARICSQGGRLTSKFGRVADLAREAALICQQADQQTVDADHVRRSIRASKGRAEMPARRFHRMLAEGTLLVNVEGTEIGQVNALAVTSVGTLMYGFPCRVTGSIGPGTGGAINIERESSMSGTIHTKGFLILGGLLRQLLRAEHPMSFSASIAFEQSYGGIDGDSASGAEFCCLTSALTSLPMRQDLAMTGAVDQRGNIMPIGGVNEKIEGFFDACKNIKFTGTQGVIIPRVNLKELMLREDVVEAIKAGEFSVYAISHIREALELFLNIESGEWEEDDYTAGSILQIARQRAQRYWQMTSKDTPV